MIRGASLLKDTESGSSPAEVDELRAELIKQKILFEAELRRQREVSDERFDTISRQLQNVLDDNTQLRRTLHALGDRLSIAEHQQTQLLANQRATAAARGISPSSRSISPVVHHQSNRYGSNTRQQHQLRSADRRVKNDTEENDDNNTNIRQQQLRRSNTPKSQSTAENSKDPSSAQRSSAIRRASSAGKNNNNSTIKNKTNSSSLLSSGSTTTSHYPRTTQPPRQASPVPKILHVQNGNHQFVKIRSSPTTTPSQSANQTPRTTTTPRQPVTRTASNVSTKSNPTNNNTQNQNQQNVVTSPAHIQFRPVLRSHTNTSSTGSVGGGNHNNNSGNNSQNTSGIVFNNNTSSDQIIGTNASLIRPFRSPMRQSDADKIGKQQVVHQSRWK